MIKYGWVFIFILCLIGCVQETQEVVKEKGKQVEVKGKKVLMVIASSNFRDEEYFRPYEIFNTHGLKVITASSSLEISRGMLRGEVKPDILLNEVKVEDYDAIVFVGGTGAAEYWDDKTAHHLAQTALVQDKVLAAICLAPITLANAGVLRNRSATVFFTEAERLTEKGADYTAREVEISENIITANGPQAAEKFAQTIVKLLNQKAYKNKE